MVNEIILYYDARSKKHQIVCTCYLCVGVGGTKWAIHFDVGRGNEMSKNSVLSVVITCLQADAIGEAQCVLNKNQQAALFRSQFISIINLYVFRAGLLLIIRGCFSASSIQLAASKHKHMTYQLLYIQKTTS